MNFLESEVRRIGESNEEKIFELLASIESDIANTNIDFLMDLLRKSNRRWIINGSSLALGECTIRQDEVKGCLIAKLLNMQAGSDIGTLVFACSSFDCSEQLRFFMKLIFIGNDEVVTSAIRNWKYEKPEA